MLFPANSDCVTWSLLPECILPISSLLLRTLKLLGILEVVNNISLKEVWKILALFHTVSYSKRKTDKYCILYPPSQFSFLPQVLIVTLNKRPNEGVFGL